MRLDSFFSERVVRVRCRFVEPQLNHREVRRGRLQIITEPQPGHLLLRRVEFLEIAPEMDEQEIALMAEERIDRALAPSARLLHPAQSRGTRRLLHDGGPAFRRQFTPRRPSESHHLMQYA